MNTRTRIDALEIKAEAMRVEEACPTCSAPQVRSEHHSLHSPTDVHGVCPDCRRVLDEHGKPFVLTGLTAIVMLDPRDEADLIPDGSGEGFIWKPDGGPTRVDAEHLVTLTRGRPKGTEEALS